ncbi:hypothetical protein [Azospirillum halopraeferens]|uniref:hypothetical protein n=1 Tax=Azospirillum halopraeferens TaxID=34010 RepID=UPI00048B65A8|nr:hypothetical protein [Azospirillum halopraeferens]
MVWRRSYGREEVRELLGALEAQARDAMALAERAQRDMDQDRFASFLDFRKKVEEVRALLALTEERLRGLTDRRLDDLRAEFERMDILLTGLLVKSMRDYFAGMRDDQVLPIGARELFEPEVRNLEQIRTKLTRPPFAERIGDGVMADLEETLALIRKTISRAPALPDFSDAPTAPKPLKRLRNLARTIRN